MKIEVTIEGDLVDFEDDFLRQFEVTVDDFLQGRIYGTYSITLV
jgi:hypothetical protein